MRSFHTKVSSKQASSDPSTISAADWNDLHSVGSVVTAYNANGTVPTSVDFIDAQGSSGGIALVLTPGQTLVKPPVGAGVIVYQRYEAVKNDAAAGAIVFTSLSGELINGVASYSLSNQWQWVVFIWNGTAWRAFGN